MTRVLFLGCHADDIELGCGGTIHKNKGVWDISCVTLSKSSFSPLGENGEHPDIWMCQKEALSVLGVDGTWLNHRTNFFYLERNEIYLSLVWARESIRPDIVFTQMADDHQDHEVLAKETMRVFQSHSVIQYHIPRSQRAFCSNYYQVLSEDDFKAKTKALDCYPMYKEKKYFCHDFIKAQMLSAGCYIGADLAECFLSVQLIN